MPPQVVKPFLLAGLTVLLGSPQAKAGFVENRVRANGGCAAFLTAFDREVKSAQPFGRPVAEWTANDVTELEDVGLSCVAGPPPILPGSPGARFKRTVAEFRWKVESAQHDALVGGGNREMEDRVVASQARDRERQDRDKAEADRAYEGVVGNTEAWRRQSDVRLEQRRRAMEAQREANLAFERKRREQEIASDRERLRQTQQMAEDRAQANQQIDYRAREIIQRARSLLNKTKGTTSSDALQEIAALRSEIGTIQNSVQGQLGSELFSIDTDLLDASGQIKQRLDDQARRAQNAEPAQNGPKIEQEAPGAGTKIDNFELAVRPGISEFGGFTVRKLRACLQSKPGGRVVTMRQDGHANRYILRTESKSDVSWAEFVLVANNGQAHVPEVRGYSAEYQNDFYQTDWRYVMIMLAQACAGTNQDSGR